MRWGSTAAVLSALLGWTVPATAAEGAGCAPRGTSVPVEAINERAEIVLHDGRTLKLAGIDVAHATTDHPQLGKLARQTLETWLVGHPVSVEPLDSGPDRWGRTVANVYAPADFASSPGEADISAAFVLVDAGLARAKPAFGLQTCFHDLVTAEASARQDRLGLWQDAFYMVIPADDEQRLARRGGMFVIVEGTVTRVGHGSARTFLDFGPTRDSFTAVIAKRARNRGHAAVPQPDDLKGVRLRVRGTLDIRFGPRIEVTDADEIERL